MKGASARLAKPAGKAFCIMICLLGCCGAWADETGVTGRDAICTEENPGDEAGRLICVADWDHSYDLAMRYLDQAVAGQNSMSPAEAFWDSLDITKVHPMTLFSNCTMFPFLRGMMDWRRVWDCIGKYDPSVADWDRL